MASNLSESDSLEISDYFAETTQSGEITLEKLMEQRRSFIQRNREYITEIVKKSGPLSDEEILIIIKERAFDFLDNAICYTDNPKYEQFLQKAISLALNEYPWKIIENAELISGKHYEEVVLIEAAKRNPGMAKIFIDQIKDEKIHDKVLAKIYEILGNVA